MFKFVTEFLQSSSFGSYGILFEQQVFRGLPWTEVMKIYAIHLNSVVVECVTI